MKIFMTGASGFIGSATARELLEQGHTVLGLARSDKSAEALTAAGIEVRKGSLEDLESLRARAAASDGVIHLGFIHDFVDMVAAAQTDLHAIEAMATELEGKPLVIAGGTLMVQGLGRTATEKDTVDASKATGRAVSENTTIALAEKGVRSAVVRLSPTVHGEGDHGFIARLISIARERGVSAYVGEGMNKWPAVHRLDAAHLFALAVQNAPAGSRLNGVGDEGITLREIADVIGRHLNVPVSSVSPDEAMTHFGFLGALVQMDNPTSSALTQELLGWKPTHPGLIADLDEGHYFAG